MICNYCGREVPDAKKTCPHCGSVMTGFIINNVTGEYGYRDEDGKFTPYFKMPESRFKRMCRWLKRYWKYAIVIAAAIIAGLLVYYEPMRLMKALLVLVLWEAILVLTFVTKGMYNSFKNNNND